MRQIHQSGEIELLQQCLQGSSDSFAVIVGRYQSLVCGLTFALTGNFGKSEELAQETFVLAWKNLRQLRDLSKFKSWLCQITRSVVQNWQRRAQRDVIEDAVPLGQVPEPTTLQAEPSNQVIREEEQTVVNQAIESMPEKYRLPLILFYREDKSHREVAQLIELSENATRQRITRARAMLKEQVAQMVETSLEQTKPGKVFTGAVLASIAAVTLKGTSVSAATGAVSKTLSAGFSGLAVKISVVAAGLVLLAGVTYTIIAQKPSGSLEKPAAPSTAITELDTGDADRHLRQAQLSSGHLDNPMADAERIVSPVAASEAVKSPEELAKDVGSTGDSKETYRLICVDTDNKPLAGALVYILQLSYPAKPSIVNGHSAGPNYQEDGPLTSNANGLVEFLAFRSPDGQEVKLNAYALLPKQRVGVWEQRIPFGEENNEQAFKIVLHESKTVIGQVLVPPGYDIASVYVDIMTIGHPAPGERFGHSFDSFILEQWGILPGVFDVPIDVEGRFEVPDLPVEGNFNLRARGPGLAEAQQHILDAQRTDFVELKLIPQGMIEGTVRFADTQVPAVDRVVSCNTYSNGGIARAHVGTTNDDGYYRIEGLNSGMYEVWVNSYEYPPKHITHALDAVEVKAGQVTGSIDFKLETGTIVTGTITDKATKVPIEGVMVVAQTPTNSGGISIVGTQSDEDGLYALRVPVGETRFYIAGVPKGVKYPEDQGVRLISVTSTGEILESVDYTLEANPIRTPKNGTATVTGRVLDTDGRPISGVLITERHMLEDELISVSNRKLGSTDEEGRFRVEVQEKVVYQIRVGGYEWSAQFSEWFELEDNESKDLGDFYLVSYDLTMSVQILDQEGNPLSNVRLGVNADDYYRSGFTKSDTDGMVYLEHLPASEISIGLFRDGYERQSWKGLPEGRVEIVMKKK